MPRFESTLSRVVRFGLYVLVAALPFIVTPRTTHPFIFGKTLFLQTAVVILFAFYLPLALAVPKYRPRLTPLLLTLSLYLLVLVVAAVFGVDPTRSFWGTEERGMGLVTLLHLGVFFVMMQSIFTGWNDWRRILRLLVISGIALSFIALSRLWGVKLYGADLGFRLSGTLANPSFFAAVLIFEILFALILAVREKQLSLRIFFGIVALGQFLMLFSTKTRGAIIGFLSGFIIFVFLLALKSGRRARVGAVLVLLVLIVAGIFLRINRDSEWIRSVPPLRKIAQISVKDSTARTRLISWESAYMAFRVHSFLGWGPENFNIAFNRFYNPELLAYGRGETWSDRPHNIFLEVAAGAGIIGLIAYLAIFGVTGALLLRKNFGKWESSLFIAGLGAYFFQNLFIFDTPSSLLLFIITLAVIDLRSRNNDSISKKPPGKATMKVSGFPEDRAIGARALFFTLPLAFVIVWKIDVQPMRASSALSTAMAAASEQNPYQSLPFFRNALATPSPYKTEARTEFAKTIMRMVINGNIKKEDFGDIISSAVEGLNLAIKEHPRDVYPHLLLGRLYSEAVSFDSSYAPLAETALQKALELSPNRQEILFGIARLAIIQGDLEKAKEIYVRTIVLEPRVGEAHMYYAVLLNDTVEKEESKKEMAQAARLGYVARNLDEALLLARAALREGDLLWVVVNFKNAVDFAPNRADLYAQLAVANSEYLKILTDPKHIETAVREAREAAKKAAELDSSYQKEAEQFLKNLEKNYSHTLP